MSTETATGQALTSIRLDLLDPNPWQPAGRQDSDISELVDSIKARGVIQAIRVIANGDRYTIIAGERRARAAREAGMTEIRAEVVDATVVDQIQDLLAENMQRVDFTTLQAADGLQAALELGVTPAVLSAVTGRSEAQLRLAVTIAKAPAKTRAKIPAQATLDEAVALLEFAGDKDKLERLERAVGQVGFRHELETVRKQRERQAAVRSAREDLERAGVPIVQDTYGAGIQQLRHLGITVEDHTRCPGHAAYVDPHDGSVSYLCTKAKLHGKSGAAGGGLTDAEKAARKAKKEGKLVWAAATTVRREFITALCARASTIPPAVLPFTAHIAWEDGLYRGRVPEYATTWETKRARIATELGGAATQSIYRLFAQACAVLEQVIENWVESSGATDARYASEDLARYYDCLGACGYVLAPCETAAHKAASSKAKKRTATTPEQGEGPAQVSECTAADTSLTVEGRPAAPESQTAGQSDVSEAAISVEEVNCSVDSAPILSPDDPGDTFKIPTCRICGCTDEDACDDGGVGCHWVEPDLCSACVAEAYPSEPDPGVSCPDCEGDGRPFARDGSRNGNAKCKTCGGTGVVATPVEAATPPSEVEAGVTIAEWPACAQTWGCAKGRTGVCTGDKRCNVWQRPQAVEAGVTIADGAIITSHVEDGVQVIDAVERQRPAGWGLRWEKVERDHQEGTFHVDGGQIRALRICKSKMSDGKQAVEVFIDGTGHGIFPCGSASELFERGRLIAEREVLMLVGAASGARKPHPDDLPTSGLSSVSPADHGALFASEASLIWGGVKDNGQKRWERGGMAWDLSAGAGRLVLCIFGVSRQHADLDAALLSTICGTTFSDDYNEALEHGATAAYVAAAPAEVA